MASTNLGHDNECLAILKDRQGANYANDEASVAQITWATLKQCGKEGTAER